MKENRIDEFLFSDYLAVAGAFCPLSSKKVVKS
jgi:hypothetical protein